MTGGVSSIGRFHRSIEQDSRMKRNQTEPGKTKSERTRRAIKSAFFELYQTTDITRISVRDVSERAGCGRSTFYLHFHDVYEVLDELEKEQLAWVRRTLTDSGALADPHQTVLPDLLIRLYEEKGEVLYCFVNRDPKFRQKVKELLTESGSLLFPFVPDWKRDAAKEIGFAAVIAGLNFWYENRDRITPEEFVPFLRERLYYGIPECGGR